MVDQWPVELREAWRTRTIAQDMEHQIPTTEEVGVQSANPANPTCPYQALAPT